MTSFLISRVPETTEALYSGLQSTLPIWSQKPSQSQVQLFVFTHVWLPFWGDSLHFYILYLHAFVPGICPFQIVFAPWVKKHFKLWALKWKRLESKFWLSHLVVLWPWALKLSFLICHGGWQWLPSRMVVRMKWDNVCTSFSTLSGSW